MADTTITGLPNASALSGAERVPMDQSGTTVDAAASAIAGLATAATVGLGNCNNTSDLNKPVSTAAQTALDLKANSSGTLAQFAATTSAQLLGVISDETGTGSLVFATSPTLVTPALGTPASGTLTNCTGLPATGVTGLGTLATQSGTFSGTSSGTNTGDQDLSGKANTGTIGSSGLTMATARLLGRTTASTGAVEEIQVSGGTFAAGVLTLSSLPASLTADGSGDLTLTARWIQSTNGSASAPPHSLTGTWFTGGTTTTTKPQFLIEPAGTTSNAWSVSGTGFGVNAASGFTGNLLDLQVNGTPQVTISSTGAISFQRLSTNSLISPVAYANALLLQTNIEPLYVLPTRSTHSSPKFSFCHVSNAGRTPGFNISSEHSLNWNDGTNVATANADLRLFRDAANTLAQRNDTAAQTSRIYNTYTSATNFERLNIRWDSNQAIIDTEAGSGGGTLRGLRIGSATTSLLGFFNATPVAQPAAVADATDAASVITQLNLALARLRALGLIAT